MESGSEHGSDQWPERLQTLILELRPGGHQQVQWARDKAKKCRKRTRKTHLGRRHGGICGGRTTQGSHTRAQTQRHTAEEIAEGIRHRQRYMQLNEQLRAAVDAADPPGKQKLEEARSKMGRDANDKSGERGAAGQKAAHTVVRRDHPGKQSRSSKRRDKMGRDANDKVASAETVKKLRAAMVTGEITRASKASSKRRAAKWDATQASAAEIAWPNSAAASLSAPGQIQTSGTNDCSGHCSSRLGRRSWPIESAPIAPATAREGNAPRYGAARRRNFNYTLLFRRGLGVR